MVTLIVLHRSGATIRTNMNSVAAAKVRFNHQNRHNPTLVCRIECTDCATLFGFANPNILKRNPVYADSIELTDYNMTTNDFGITDGSGNQERSDWTMCYTSNDCADRTLDNSCERGNE